MRYLGLLTLILIGALTCFSWWLAGGANWYGAAVVALLAAKSVLSWSARDAVPRSARSQRYLRELNVGVAVPFYNEDPALLEGTLESILGQTRLPQSVVLVDDGSTDDAAAAAGERWVGRFQKSGIELQVIRFEANRGKREALVAALDRQPDADALFCVDSDTVLTANALEQVLIPFADREVQAATGLVLPLNYDKNLLTRLMDVRYANGFLFERAAYSRLGSVLCVCGSLALYRTSLLRKYREDFLGQTFLGQPAVFGDDRRLTNYALLEGKVLFQSRSVAFTAVPEKLGHYIRQQVRWNKSYFRESLWAIQNLPPSRPGFWITVTELGTWVTFTLMIAYALIVAPLVTGAFLLGPYLMYMVLLAYARSVRYFEATGIRKRKREVFYGYLLAPLYGLMHILLLVWLRVYALATLRSGAWGTRKTVEVSV